MRIQAVPAAAAWMFAAGLALGWGAPAWAQTPVAPLEPAAARAAAGPVATQILVPAAASSGLRMAVEPAQRLAGVLAGEWNNHEQVWQQRIDAAKPLAVGAPAVVVPEHLHTVLAPVVLPQLPGVWLYVQRSAGEDLQQLRRQALWKLATTAAGQVMLQPQVFVDPARWTSLHHQSAEVLARLSAADVRPEAGCDALLIKPLGEAELQTDAAAAQKSCAEMPLQLSANGLLQHGSAGHLRSRKVRYFEGWVWFRNAGPGASTDDKDTSFTAKYALHSEGQKVVLLRKDGTASPWQLELALLTYQNTRRPILKFALLDRATGKSIAYTWANTEASNVGMNLGWFQAGVTQRNERVHFASLP